MKAADIESLKRKILVIYSAGCGNGKSEIAANLAFSIARQGIRTWVLDANTFAPMDDYIFGYTPDGPTFSHFLIKPSIHEIPIYPMDRIYSNPQPVPLLLTHAERKDKQVRFDLQEILNSDMDIYSKIPEAVYKVMIKQNVDLLIIDTHPSFERINEVWMGMTDFLLIISRINPVDLKNLRALLQDPSIRDISQKMVVFTNVKIDTSRKASKDMANTTMTKVLQKLHRQFDQDCWVFDYTNPENIPAGRTDFYERPFLYSEKLALFQQSSKRKGMFIDKEPKDSFSVNIKRLGKRIVDMAGINI